MLFYVIFDHTFILNKDNSWTSQTGIKRRTFRMTCNDDTKEWQPIRQMDVAIWQNLWYCNCYLCALLWTLNGEMLWTKWQLRKVKDVHQTNVNLIINGCYRWKTKIAIKVWSFNSSAKVQISLFVPKVYTRLSGSKEVAKFLVTVMELWLTILLITISYICVVMAMFKIWRCIDTHGTSKTTVSPNQQVSTISSDANIRKIYASNLKK